MDSGPGGAVPGLGGKAALAGRTHLSAAALLVAVLRKTLLVMAASAVGFQVTSSTTSASLFGHDRLHRSMLFGVLN